MSASAGVRRSRRGRLSVTSLSSGNRRESLFNFCDTLDQLDDGSLAALAAKAPPVPIVEDMDEDAPANLPPGTFLRMARRRSLSPARSSGSQRRSQSNTTDASRAATPPLPSFIGQSSSEHLQTRRRSVRFSVNSSAGMNDIVAAAEAATAAAAAAAAASSQGEARAASELHLGSLADADTAIAPLSSDERSAKRQRTRRGERIPSIGETDAATRAGDERNAAEPAPVRERRAKENAARKESASEPSIGAQDTDAVLSDLRVKPEREKKEAGKAGAAAATSASPPTTAPDASDSDHGSSEDDGENDGSRRQRRPTNESAAARKRRMERNRRSARMSRERKKKELNDLQIQLAHAQARNTELEAALAERKRNATVAQLEEENQRLRSEVASLRTTLGHLLQNPAPGGEGFPVRSAGNSEAAPRGLPSSAQPSQHDRFATGSNASADFANILTQTGNTASLGQHGAYAHIMAAPVGTAVPLPGRPGSSSAAGSQHGIGRRGGSSSGVGGSGTYEPAAVQMCLPAMHIRTPRIEMPALLAASANMPSYTQGSLIHGIGFDPQRSTSAGGDGAFSRYSREAADAASQHSALEILSRTADSSRRSQGSQ